MRRVVTAICALLVLAGCSEPPQKEIDRAEGAIEAARAAGAEQYAPESFTAATTALRETHEAVQQRDYRLALSRAIDANDRALEAATQGADGKARARGEAEAALARATTALRQLDERLKAAAASRLTTRELAPARSLRASVERSLQEADTAVGRDDFPAATAAVRNVPQEVAVEIQKIDELIAQRAARRRR